MKEPKQHTYRIYCTQRRRKKKPDGAPGRGSLYTDKKTPEGSPPRKGSKTSKKEEKRKGRYQPFFTEWDQL